MYMHTRMCMYIYTLYALVYFVGRYWGRVQTGKSAQEAQTSIQEGQSETSPEAAPYVYTESDVQYYDV